MCTFNIRPRGKFTSCAGANLHPLLRVHTWYANKLCPFVLDLTRLEDKLVVFQ